MSWLTAWLGGFIAVTLPFQFPLEIGMTYGVAAVSAFVLPRVKKRKRC